jgi:hypothetical protein
MNKMLMGLAAVALFAGVITTAGLSYAETAATAPATSAPAADANANKFYGSVSAIDAKAGTFTVGEQTFVVVKESQLTKADGSTATLADAVVGEPARGTFEKGADGKLNVTKVRFGKKAGGGAGGKGGGGGGGKAGGGKKKDTAATTQQ